MTSARRVVAGEQVDTLLDGLASGSTEPGSGAFAALSAAAGAALITSVAQRTLRRLDADDEPTARLTRIADEADALRPVLFALADRNAEIHAQLAVAAKMPRATDEQRTSRLVRLQSVLEDAVNVQLDLARRSVLLAGLAEEVTVVADPNAAGDGLAAAAAVHAAALAALANVRLNAFAVADPDRRSELTETCTALGERAASMLRATRQAFERRVHFADP